MSSLEQRLIDRIWADLFGIQTPNELCDTLTHQELEDMMQTLSVPLDIPTKVFCHQDRFDAAAALVDEIAQERVENYLGDVMIAESPLVPKDKLLLAAGSRLIGIIDIGELK